MPSLVGKEIFPKQLFFVSTSFICVQVRNEENISVCVQTMHMVGIVILIMLCITEIQSATATSSLYKVWEIYFSFPKQNVNQLNPSWWTLKLLWKWFAWQNSPTNNSHSLILDALCNVHNFVTLFHSRAVDPEDWLTGKAPSIHPLKKEKKSFGAGEAEGKGGWSGMGGLLVCLFF